MKRKQIKQSVLSTFLGWLWFITIVVLSTGALISSVKWLVSLIV